MNKLKNKFIIECIEIHQKLNFDKICYGKVHSIFKNVLNIKVNNRLISLLTNKFLKAPYSIICEIDDFNKIDIERGEEVYLSNQKLEFSNIIIDLSKCNKYYLDKLPKITKTEILESNINLIRKYYIENHYFIYENLIYVEFEKKLDIVKKAIQDNNFKLVKEELSSFFGYGQGLTPTGDDIILGLYIGLNIFENKDIKKIIFNLIESNLTKTTDISIQMFEGAKENYYRMEYILFLNRLGMKNFTKDDLKIILNIGHSSGRDILRGILFSYDII